MLKEYIEKQVFNKIKQLFLDNPDDNSLKELYFEIRRNELDPVNIYPIEVVNKTITEELDKMNNQNKGRSK